MYEEIRAGDTLKFTDYSLPDYSAITYDIWIALRGTDAIDIKDGISGVTVTKDGDVFDITVTAATTANWTPGTYQYTVYAGKSSWAERYKVFDGYTEILPDIAAQSADYDGRTHAMKVLDAIEAVLESRATQDQLQYSIAGRSITKISPKELFEFRTIYKQLVAEEKWKQRADNGEGPGDKIRVKL